MFLERVLEDVVPLLFKFMCFVFSVLENYLTLIFKQVSRAQSENKTRMIRLFSKM